MLKKDRISNGQITKDLKEIEYASAESYETAMANALEMKQYGDYLRLRDSSGFEVSRDLGLDMELDRVLRHLNSGARSYGCETLIERILIEDNDRNAGKAVLRIEPEEFLSKSGGYFTFDLKWPELKSDGEYYVRLGVSYCLNNQGEAIMLTPGGARSADNNWRSIHTASVKVADVIAAAFIAEKDVAQVVSFVSGSKPKDDFAILKLTPTTPVSVVLRGTIVPVDTERRKMSGNARAIVNTKAPGADANLGAEFIHTFGAEILSSPSAIVMPEGVKPLSFADLLAKYGKKPVAFGGEATANPAGDLPM